MKKAIGITLSVKVIRRNGNMKNFKNYTPEKYATFDFQIIEEGIYKTKSRYSVGDEDVFVTSLTFEMEPECYGEEYYNMVME